MTRRTMFGIKIAKIPAVQGPSKWPGEYHSLHVLLRPIADALQPLWWATERAVYAFPPNWMSEEWQQPYHLSGPSTLKFDEFFLPDIRPTVARPGFLPTYAHTIGGDWSMLHGLTHDPSHDPGLLKELGRIDWFDSMTRIPAEVAITIRGIDWAYWEIFACDQTLIVKIYNRVKDVAGLKVELLEQA